MDDHGWKRADPHSWWLIFWEFKRIFRKFKNQAWRTQKSFKKDYDKGIAKCPNCGSKDDFDID